MADPILHPTERQQEYDPYRYDRTPMQPRYSTGFLMQKAFENTREDLLGMNAGKFLFSDPIAADSTMSPLMSPGDAKAKYNVDTGDDWLTEAQVAERSYLNMRRAERESVLSRASGFWQKSAIVGTTFAATFTDPAEVALAIISFVGSTSYARLLARLAPAAKAGQMAFEAERVAMGFGRPLAVLEQMAGGKAKWGARAIAGATEGTLGTASYIPANWWIMSQQGRDFDSTEAFRQILAGAVLGIGFRTGFGKLGDLTMSADTRKALVREATIAFSKDQVPNFETIHALDEVRVWREQVDVLGNERPEYRAIADEILRGRWPPLKPAPLMIVPRGEVPMPNGKMLSVGSERTAIEVEFRNRLEGSETGLVKTEQQIPKETPVMTSVQSASGGSILYVEFDGMHRIPTVKEIEAKLVELGVRDRVEISLFGPDFSAAMRGTAKFRIDIFGDIYGESKFKGRVEDVSNLIREKVFGKTSNYKTQSKAQRSSSLSERMARFVQMVQEKAARRAGGAAKDADVEITSKIDGDKVTIEVRPITKSLTKDGPVIDVEHEKLSSITITAERWKQLVTEEKRQMMLEEDFRKSFNRDLPKRISDKQNQIISSLQAKQLNRDLLTFVQGPELDRVRQEVIDHERLDPTNPDDMEKIAASAEKFSNDLLDDAGRRLDETDLEAINTMHNEAMQKLSAEEKAIDVAIGCVTTHA